MERDQYAGLGHLSRERLLAELVRAHERIADLEAERGRSHERLLDSIASHLNDGFSLLSPTGVQLDVNPAFCAMVGFSREELIGHDIPQPYWPPEDHALAQRRFARLLEADATSFEVAFVRKSGERFPALITPTVVRDEDDQPFCVFATIKDLTAQRSVEEALNESEARYRSVVEHAPIGIFESTRDGRLTYANPAEAAIFGYASPAEMVEAVNKVGLAEALYEDPAVRGELVGSAPKASHDWRVSDRRARRKDGSTFDARVYLGERRDLNGGGAHLFGFVEDVTAQKRAEMVIQERERTLSTLMSNLPGMAYRCASDDQWTIQFVSDGCEALTGYPPEALVGKAVTAYGDIVWPADRATLWTEVQGAIKSGRPWTCPYRIVTASGERRWVWERGGAVQNDDGEVVLEGFIQDVTAQHESELRYRSLFEDSPVALWEEDHSKVKVLLEQLVASEGVEDVAGYLHRHVDEYERCLGLAHTLDANRAAVALFEAAGRDEAIARQDELYPQGTVGGLAKFWAAMLAGRRSATYEEVNLTLAGRELHVLETANVAPGHEDSFDRVYLADVDVTERRLAESALTRTKAQLENTLKAAVTTLGTTTELRDPYTAGHQRRVAVFACAIAEELAWPQERIAVLRTAALLHDIGKILIPAEILSKPGRLSDNEFSIIRQHARVGAEILADIDFGADVAGIVGQHHERLDGSGYPEGLKDGDILPEARILAVADVVEAMNSHRPYRPALPLETAIEEIEAGAGGRYDSVACEAAIRLLREKGFTFSE